MSRRLALPLLLAALVPWPKAGTARADGGLRFESSLGFSALADRGDSRAPVGNALLIQPRVTYFRRPLEEAPGPYALWAFLQRRPSLTLGADLLGGVVDEPPGTTTSPRLRESRWLLGASASAYLPQAQASARGTLALLVGVHYLHQRWSADLGRTDREQIGWRLGGEWARSTIRLRLLHDGWLRFQDGDRIGHVEGQLALEAVDLPARLGVSLEIAGEWSSGAVASTFYSVGWRGFVDLFVGKSFDLYSDLAIAITATDVRFQPSFGLRLWPTERIGIALLYRPELRIASSQFNDRELFALDLTLTGRFR